MGALRAIVRGLGAIGYLSGAVGTAAFAADFDGSKPLICAPTDIISCHGAGDCGRMTSEESAVPQFIRLDFKRGEASGILSDGKKNVSKLTDLKKLAGAIVIQGMTRDGTRPYSARIDGTHGGIAIAVAGDGGGMLILGACTPD